MTILSSIDGKFYDVPDEECGRYEVPADKVKDVLEAMDSELGGEHGGVAPYGAPAPHVVIHVSGNGAMLEEFDPDADPEGSDVEPYGWGRHRRGHHGGSGHHHGGWGGGWGGGPWVAPWRRRRRRRYWW